MCNAVLIFKYLVKPLCRLLTIVNKHYQYSRLKNKSLEVINFHTNSTGFQNCMSIKKGENNQKLFTTVLITPLC